MTCDDKEIGGDEPGDAIQANNANDAIEKGKRIKRRFCALESAAAACQRRAFGCGYADAENRNQ